MVRIPYDIVAIKANQLIIKMVLASINNINYYWALYIIYIEACGWTDQEFDSETLYRIDAAWDNEQQVWN